MSKMAPDLFERLKDMPKEELEAYLLTAKITGGIAAVVGIGTIVLALMFTTWVSIITTFIVLHLFGNIAVVSENLKTYIVSLLKSKFSDK